MIPRVVHYCWFGRGPLPADARRCIDSWRRYLPGWEIKEWNEDNFPVDACAYTAEAYRQKKYAFVSDYARFKVLYQEGGVYFDTDVELIRPLDDLLERGPFMGIEKSLATNGTDPTQPVGVGPGLGIAAEAGMGFFAEMLRRYEGMTFDLADGTVVAHTTALLRERGFRNENTMQQVAGLTIYPDDYLCPMDSTTGLVHKTPNTVSIHHYSCSWMNRKSLSFRLHLLKNRLNRLLGPRIVMPLSRLLKQHQGR